MNTENLRISEKEEFHALRHEIVSLLRVVCPEGKYRYDREIDLSSLTKDPQLKTLDIKAEPNNYSNGILMSYRIRLNSKGYGADADYHCRVGKAGSPSRVNEIDNEGFGYDDENGQFQWFHGDLEEISDHPELLAKMKNLARALSLIEEKTHPSFGDQSPEAALRRREIRKVQNPNTPTRDLERAIKDDQSGEKPLAINSDEKEDTGTRTDATKEKFSFRSMLNKLIAKHK